MLNLINKPFIIFILFWVGFNSTTHAQKFKGGFYLGMTASQVHGDNLGGYDKAGLNAGFYTAINITPNARLALELAFLQKGAKEPPSDTSNFYKLSLGYFEIPLLFQYRWRDLSFEIGPALDINVYSNEAWDGFERESIPPYNTLSLTGIVGVSWHFTEKVHINFRTNNSLTSIRDGNANPADNPSIQRFGSFGQKNIVLSFALVYNMGVD
jgi:hypothetical protein